MPRDGRDLQPAVAEEPWARAFLIRALFAGLAPFASVHPAVVAAVVVAAVVVAV